MGCSSSKSTNSNSNSNSKPSNPVNHDKPSNATTTATATPAVSAKPLNPADFMCTRLSDQVIVKEPGSIAGQQFIIEECVNCDIYLMDHSATVTVDECKQCRIFIGPCESSVFIRTCTDCKFIVAAQQLRTRDCRNLDILVYVGASQPVIENSINMHFSCFNFNYFGLQQQFIAAGLEPWSSEWSNVHDFHSEQGGRKHFDYLPHGTTAADLGFNLEPVTSLVTSGFIVPVTYGKRARAKRQLCLVLLWSEHHQLGYELLDKLQSELNSEQLLLLRTRVVPYSAKDKNKLNGMFKKNEALVKAAMKGRVLGLEFDGATPAASIQSVVTASGYTNAQLFVSADNDTTLIDSFFEAIAQV